MLEDVYTTPEARGRGLATAVIAAVLHAARAERHEIVFVPTDAVGGARAALRAARLRAADGPALADRPARREPRRARDRLAARLPRRRLRSRIEPWAHGTVVARRRRAQLLRLQPRPRRGRRPGPGRRGAGRGRRAGARRPRPPPDRGRGRRRPARAWRRASRRWAGSWSGWRSCTASCPPARPAARTAPSCASRPSRPRGRCAQAWQGESIWGDEAGFALLEEQVAARRGTRAVVGYLRRRAGRLRRLLRARRHGRGRDWSSACPSAATAASAARWWPARSRRRTPTARATR